VGRAPDQGRSAVRPHHQALRQNRAGTDVDLTEDHCRTSNLRLRLVNEHVIEAHGGLTVLLAIPASSRPVPTLRAHHTRPVTPSRRFWLSAVLGAEPHRRTFQPSACVQNRARPGQADRERQRRCGGVERACRQYARHAGPYPGSRAQCRSPSHDHRGMLIPSGTSSADSW
jgi:hypothetical protein